MPQIFHRATNPLSKASIFGGVFILAVAVYIADLLYKGPYVDEQKVIREQPVPFSHKHHVQGLGIDCRYCHTSVEDSAFAGIPPAATCMTCHSQIWTNAAMLEPVRQSYFSGKLLVWLRINSLPDFVYFDHSIHVARGIACDTCHGPVEAMPLSWRESSLHMKWCLDCHRQPDKHVPPAMVRFVQNKNITDCYTCHR